MNTHCKIGRITLKASGTEVRVITPRERNETTRGLVQQATALADIFDGKINGFAIVAWDEDLSWSRATCCGKMGLTMMPAFVQEVLRRAVSADVTKSILRGDE